MPQARGMRLGADEQSVAAAGVPRVPHDRLHVLLVADVLQDAGAELVADAGCRRTPRRARGSRAVAICAIVRPTVSVELGVGDAADLQGVPLGDHAVAAVGAV